MLDLTGFHCSECGKSIKLQSNLLSMSDESNSLSNRLNLTRKLFELAAGTSQVQHPLCGVCSGELIINLERKLANLKQELEDYQKLEFPEPIKITVEDLSKLESEREDALKTLRELLTEKSELEKEYAELKKEMEEVEEDESDHWQEINQFESICFNISTEINSLNIVRTHVLSQLERLKKTNIYNDAFRITHDGPFGMINGQRIGRLSEIPVDW